MNNYKLILESTKDLNVLYVEDDIELQTTIKELLTNFFNSVDSAENGKVGLEKYLEYYNKNNSYYDLVVTDINMPVMDGIDMSINIRKHNFDQSILVVSAHNEVDYLSSAIEIGVNGFVAKPIKHEQFSNVLYKTSQAISDRKFVQEHVGRMEDLNIQLEQQNRELLAKNLELEKSSRMLDTIVHKEQISHVISPVSTKVNSEVNVKAQEIPLEEDSLLTEQIQDLIHDDLNELRDIHTEIDVCTIDIIKNIESVDPDAIPCLAGLFTKYASILALYNFFEQLSTSIAHFSRVLQDNPLPSNKDTVKNIFILLESFIYVLGKWQEDLVSGDDSKINSLDDSIISDMHTITNIYLQNEIEEEVCEEALDDIFDF